jgi:hypothetical protein
VLTHICVQDVAGVLVVSKSFFDDAKIPQDLQQTFPSLSLHEIKFLLEHFIPDKYHFHALL